MERRSILQNILDITAVFAAQPPTPPKDRNLSQPRVGLGSAPKIFPRLLATGLPKKLSSKLNAIYHNRASHLQAAVVEQLAETWLNLCQKSMLDDKLLRARFKVLADALIRQLKEGRNRLVEVAIDSARTHAEEIRSRPRPKWNKAGPFLSLVFNMVPIFEWIFDHNFGRYPSLNERHALAQASGLTYRQIVVWFQNRRARSKKRLAAEAAALERAENASEGSELSPLPPTFLELLRQDPRIRPKRLIVEHLAALSPPADSDADVQEFLGIPEEEIVNDGRFLSARDEEELIIREEYRCGIRRNELDSVDPPSYSFPQQMQKEPSLPAPSFPSPKWHRQPVAEEPSFLPVRTDEVILLHMQLENLCVTPAPEDEMIATLCETYSVLDLDGVGTDLDAESSADCLVPELDDDRSGDSDEDSEGPSTSPEASPVSQLPEEVQDTAFPFSPSHNALSPVQSLRILRRGVGKIPLLRTTVARAKLSSRPMAPPPRPRPKKLAVCKNVFNGRPKSIRKSQLPIIRELPPLPGPTSTPASQPIPAPAPTTDQQSVVNDQVQGTDDDNDDDEGEDQYGEYIEEYGDAAVLEDVEGVQFLCEDGQLVDASVASVQETGKDNGPWDMSPEESEASFSGTSCFDSDLEEASLSYLTMENVDLSFVELHDHFRPPPDREIPECFKIPFDPVIAESALKQTLEELNITPNWAQPIHDFSALCANPYAYLVPNDESCEDPYQNVDLVALSNAATDNLYAPNPTFELGEERPTYLEEYQATLPAYSEDMDYPGPEDGYALQEAQSLDLDALAWPHEGHEFASFLSSITDVPSNDAAVAVPAIFATQDYTAQEREFPEESGDGSQYPVLDPAYDLNEWEAAIYQLPSFLPPGGIPTDGDRYPYIEPPPLESYARPLPEECRIFVSHGPTQTFDPLPPPPRRVASPPPLVVIPRPLSPLLPIPHLPLTPSQGSDGTEVPQNTFVAGFTSLMSAITSAPRYLLGGETPESSAPPRHIEDIVPMSWNEPRPPPVLPFEDEFGLQTGSIWSTLPWF